jgi:hypothetical protein
LKGLDLPSRKCSLGESEGGKAQRLTIKADSVMGHQSGLKKAPGSCACSKVGAGEASFAKLRR